MARQRRQYTRKFKLMALSRELGIRRELLYRWHDLYIGGGEAALRDSGRPRRILAVSSGSGADIAAMPAPPVVDDLGRA
ncbi:MAG TPA: helix-turn-helix domain-containing protein, partial [Acetobacteraceae bacterium]|nr:helix-turn-helix domain-containing protein [Acetobacteraceae bacterium]